VSREPTLDDLIGGDATGAERQRLQNVHEQLLAAGPPPELTPKLEAGPTLGMTLHRKRALKRRTMLLIAAVVAIVAVFFGGYAVGNHGGKGGKPIEQSVALQGTKFAPHAEGALQVWTSHDGYNWPMTLTVAGLKQLPPHAYYEVYLFRDGKIQTWGKCGAFRIGNSGRSAVTVTLTSPYTLEKGDTWVVTRPTAGGAEPGQTVLTPAQTTA
jgi:hypothetical protein